MEPKVNSLVSTSLNDDQHIIGMKKRRSNGCFLCGQKGHGRYECTVLKNMSCLLVQSFVATINHRGMN